MMNFPIIMGITSGASFLLGFLLLSNSRKANLIANRYLGLFALVLGFAMIEIPLFYQKIYLEYPNLFEMIGLIRFLTAPFLYISILYFTSFNKKFEKQNLWHFLPFLLFLIFRFPFFITGKNFEFSYETGRVVFFILKVTLPLQTIVYWCLSFRRLQKHLTNVREISSSAQEIDLSWLKCFLLVLLFILVGWLNLLFFNLNGLIKFTPLVYLVSVFFLAYFSLQQKEIFDFSKSELNDLSAIKENKKEAPKRVSEIRLNELDQKLYFSINSEKVYLNNDLSLPILAAKIGASCNETSFVINELYHDNFYNFINRYRIEEAKKLLLSEAYSQLNILGIAYEAGFNSKTTFNTTFKKHTGLSPTEFVKRNKIQTEKEP
nr:helix-turn-helix domain-containing protein [uncultured Flavobacterium sp.]